MKKEELVELIWDYSAELGGVVNTNSVLYLHPELEQDVVEEAINDFKNTEAGMFYEKIYYENITKEDLELLIMQYAVEFNEMAEVGAMIELYPYLKQDVVEEAINDFKNTNLGMACDIFSRIKKKHKR
jgi:hypothetical protein